MKIISKCDMLTVRNRAIKGNRLQDDPEAEIRRQDFKTTKQLLKFYIKEREWSRKIFEEIIMVENFPNSEKH